MPEDPDLLRKEDDLHVVAQKDHHSPIQPQSLAPPTAQTIDCEIECGPDLKTCMSVQYELKDGVQGVKLSKHMGVATEDWTLIVRNDLERPVEDRSVDIAPRSPRHLGYLTSNMQKN